MSWVWCADNDKLNLLVAEDLIDRTIDFGLHAKSLLQFSSWRCRIAFQNSVEREQLRKCENKGYMKGQPGEADTQNTRLDGRHLAK